MTSTVRVNIHMLCACTVAQCAGHDDAVPRPVCAVFISIVLDIYVFALLITFLPANVPGEGAMVGRCTGKEKITFVVCVLSCEICDDLVGRAPLPRNVRYVHDPEVVGLNPIKVCYSNLNECLRSGLSLHQGHIDCISLHFQSCRSN